MTTTELAACGLHLHNIDSDVPELHIDGSGIEAIERCRRFSQYQLVLRRESAAVNYDLWWGSLMHSCWQLWAERDGSNVATAETQALQEELIHKAFNGLNTVWQEGEWRTEGRAVEFIAAWNDHYRKRWKGKQPFKVLAVELPIKRPIGIVIGVLDKPVRVVYTGKIDLVLEDDAGKVWIKDYKTSRKFSPDLIEPEHKNSSQFKGYCWNVEQQLDRPVAGVIIQSAICNYPRERPTAKSPLPNQFEETFIEYDSGQLSGWRVNTMALVRSWLQDAAVGYWPMEGKACTKYGRRCQYWNVCLSATWKDSMDWLRCGAFKDYTWDPLGEHSVIKPSTLDSVVDA